MAEGWFIRYRNKVKGPYSARKLRKTIRQSTLPNGSEVRLGDNGTWISPDSFYSGESTNSEEKIKKRRVERVWWKCPVCDCFYEIPAEATKPKHCFECSKQAVHDETHAE